MNYICHLPMMPLRREGNHRSEMVSMIIFGEVFEILESQPDHWHRIKCRLEGYEGWIFGRGLIEVDSEFLAKYDEERPYHLVKGYYQQGMTFAGHRIPGLPPLPLIPHGARLPLFDGDRIYLGHHEILVDIAKRKVTQPPLVPTSRHIIKEASGYMGSPYLWGGRYQGGIDCSGFVQMVYKINGITLPRDAYQQAEVGTDVPSLDKAKDGDLAFFAEKERISHVGILTKKGKRTDAFGNTTIVQEIIHASECVRIDRITEEGIWNEALQQHTLKLKSIKRII